MDSHPIIPTMSKETTSIQTPQDQRSATGNQPSALPAEAIQQPLPLHTLNPGQDLSGERIATRHPAQALPLDLMEAIRQLQLNQKTSTEWPTLTPASTGPVPASLPLVRNDAVPASLRPGYSIRDPRLAARRAGIKFESTYQPRPGTYDQLRFDQAQQNTANSGAVVPRLPRGEVPLGEGPLSAPSGSRFNPSGPRFTILSRPPKPSNRGYPPLNRNDPPLSGNLPAPRANSNVESPLPKIKSREIQSKLDLPLPSYNKNFPMACHWYTTPVTLHAPFWDKGMHHPLSGDKLFLDGHERHVRRMARREAREVMIKNHAPEWLVEASDDEADDGW
ncbi:MAG: hypothetical protein Q9176_003581 [Flavoplaca citrina]